MKSYSWSDFGREAEFVIASYLKSKDWNIKFSPSSRGAADVVANKGGQKWCIQVKASLKSPHIKSEEICRLKEYASSVNGLPVFASFQPWDKGQGHIGAPIGPYMIFLYSVNDWKPLLA